MILTYTVGSEGLGHLLPVLVNRRLRNGLTRAHGHAISFAVPFKFPSPEVKRGGIHAEMEKAFELLLNTQSAVVSMSARPHWGPHRRLHRQ
jgi:hypothetical protein